MKIYIASSWKNQHAVEMLTDSLRGFGHEVISFVEKAVCDEGRSEIKFDVEKLDFDKDIYGCRIKIFFRFWLREERRFESVGLLVSQMEFDRVEALRMLS